MKAFVLFLLLAVNARSAELEAEFRTLARNPRPTAYTDPARPFPSDPVGTAMDSMRAGINAVAHEVIALRARMLISATLTPEELAEKKRLAEEFRRLFLLDFAVATAQQTDASRREAFLDRSLPLARLAEAQLKELDEAIAWIPPKLPKKAKARPA